MSVAVSFVVIGRNEGATIVDCLRSAQRAAQAAGLASHELIYVDSASTDGSVDAVRRELGGAVRIVDLTGARNAAIARNVGASFATGRVLFFTDGDVELDPSFLPQVLAPDGGLIHPIVSGRLPEKVYDGERRLVGEVADRRRIAGRGHRPNMGGVFVIERAWFEAVGGFANELRINEDLDLGLRLARRGATPLMLPVPIGVHHTVDYFHWTRIFPMIRDGSFCYPSAIFRRHLGNRHYLPILVSDQRSTLVLLASVALAVVAHPAWLLAYVGWVAAKNLRREGVSFLQELFGTTVRSVCFLVGLVAFFPRPVPPAAIVYRTADATG